MKESSKIIEKKHRLSPEIYIGGAFVSFTVCVKERVDLFNNQNIIKTFEKTLLDELKREDCAAWVYVFMPDHVHIIISGKTATADPRKCIAMFKQKTGYWLSKNRHDTLWQKNYYDHILRNNEDLIQHIKYILNNPVRAGMVSYWKEYKYFGSTEYNLYEWE
ncbi:MAG: transposase [Ignavibacteria bacterium]|nr:transposase [Ignavibacteria bacterium]